MNPDDWRARTESAAIAWREQQAEERKKQQAWLRRARELVPEMGLRESVGEDAAIWWLATALQTISHTISATSKARPWSVRNEELDETEVAVARLSHALAVLDEATIAAISLEGNGQPLVKLARKALEPLAAAVKAAKQDVRVGERPDQGADEAVKLLVGYAVRFAKWKPSAKPGGHFHQFVKAAFLAATGEERDMLRSIQRVLADGQAEISADVAKKFYKLPAK